VTVNDTQPPFVMCSNQHVAATTPVGQVVNYGPPAAGDNCPGTTASAVPPSGFFFPNGTTLATATAVDASGNTATCSFNVTVNPQLFFSEGAANAFFNTNLSLMNPDPSATANALLIFQKADGGTANQPVTVPPLTRRTILADSLPGLANAEFSTVVQSDRLLVANRLMEWDVTGLGSHLERSIPRLGTTWYLAEGATHSNFNLFYLLQNPNATAANVTVSYLLPGGQPPVMRNYVVPAASRYNIWVNLEGGTLASTDVSAIVQVTNGVQILVERAMYRDIGGVAFAAGHESAGVRDLATDWFLAEGATGPYFDFFVLIANPGGTNAMVTATYLLPSGATITKQHSVPANSRFNIWVDFEDPQLADTAVSVRLTSTVGVVVERAMWWPGGPDTWFEAHNSPGSTATATRWGLAEGEVDPAKGTETYILIANTSPYTATVGVLLVFEDGPNQSKVYTIPANARFNVDVAVEFPSAVGKRFGAIVQSGGVPPAQIVVEQAVYSDSAGVEWSAGSNALATILP
jgi:hypothetical protein